MASINFECIICAKSCQSSDEIVSTDCGHVFHDICLKKKHEGLLFSALRQPKCPQCLREIKTTTKLLFKFETGPSSKDIQIAELKAHVDHLYASRNQLQQQYEAKQTQTREQESLDLKNRIDFLIQQNGQLAADIVNKNNELQKLQTDNIQKDKEFQQINEELKQVQIQNKEFLKDIEMKTTEIQKLKAKIQQHSNNEVQNVEINTLKEKNKQLAMELAKEIRNSSQMTVEKFRLENSMEQLKLQTQHSSKTEVLKTDETSSSSKAKERDNKKPVPSVVIRNVKETFVDKAAMRSHVFMLFIAMELNIADEDVLDVSYLGGEEPNKRALVVSFRNWRVRKLVQSNLGKLRQQFQKSQSSAQSQRPQQAQPQPQPQPQEPTQPPQPIPLRVATNKHELKLLQLYNDATSLTYHGFEQVFIHNGEVYARKNSASEAIRISSYDDVDKLKNEACCIQ